MGQSLEEADLARVHFGEAQNQENYGTDMNYHGHCHCAVSTIPKIGGQKTGSGHWCIDMGEISATSSGN